MSKFVRSVTHCDSSVRSPAFRRPASTFPPCHHNEARAPESIRNQKHPFQTPLTLNRLKAASCL
jgi:hypothetical protein